MTNNNTIAHDAAVAATAYLEEINLIAPRDAELSREVIKAAVEAALMQERERLLQDAEN